MRLLRPALLLAVFGLLALAAPAPSVWAGDGAEPAAKKPVAERPAAEKPPEPTLWIYAKGGDTRALDVTDMSPEIRNALHVQMTANDWVRRSPPDAATPTKTPAHKPKASEAQSDTEKDIAELIKRGGKLPDDWRPAGMRPPPFAPGGRPSVGGPGLPAPGSPRPKSMGPVSPRALGAVVLAYLDVKQDPLKGPIYEAVLRDLAGGLVASGNAGDGMQLGMRRILAGLGDPKTAPVYQEILRLLVDTLPRAPESRPDPAPWGRFERGPGRVPPPSRAPRAPEAQQPPFAGPFAGAPTHLGGAPIGYVTQAGGAGLTFLSVGPVPTAATAHAAGLRQGDRIIRIDGKPVDEAGVRRAAKVFSEGGKLTLEVVRRDDKRETLSLLLEKE
jgi:hypothetical protein